MFDRRDFLKSGAALAFTTTAPFGAFSQQAKVLTISTTGILASANPFAHSSAHLYSLWGQVYGLCTRRNYADGSLEPLIAESWESIDNLRWRIHLNQSLVRHDGGPAPTSRDVLHSFERIRSDPASQQSHRLNEVSSVEAVDDYTFDIVTKTPFALLPHELLPRIIVTSADLFEKHGANADTVAPFGWGPYMLESFQPDNQVIVRRSPHWPEPIGNRAEVGIFRQIIEAEQRITAILNNEVQIARLIPPQMVDRVRNQPGVDLIQAGGFEYMYVGMNVKHGPWADPRMRRAVALAIDRKLIVDRVLFGLADVMDSAIGPYQDCHKVAPTNPSYDPEAARALLAEAGYPNGIDVDFYTASGRYISDRQVGQAITQMLADVGIRANLIAPDYSAFTQMVQDGACPFFYTGRAGTENPAYNLNVFYETGNSKRVNYSNARVDELFVTARAEFDDAARCELLQELSDILIEETASVFMWTHNLLQVKRSNIDWTADAQGEVWLDDVGIN